MEGKSIVISAPSGAGKTSIVRFLTDHEKSLRFSISACTRSKRGNEVDGEDYYFLSENEFKFKIANKEFLEWEQVYSNQFYGTLNSELEKIWNNNNHVIFDVDAIGGINIKKKMHNNCLALFIMPPSLDVLSKRLKSRGTDSKENIITRLDKASQEIALKDEFDHIIVNDNLEIACQETLKLIESFIK